MPPPPAARSSTPLAPAAQTSATTHSAASASATTSIHAKAVTAVALLLATLLSGCYLTGLARGELRLLESRRSIHEVLADAATSAALHRELELVEAVRHFAKTLGLRVDDEYTSYAPWPGDRVITAVVATRPGEIDPMGFRFPFLGRVPYKGYFDRAAAEHEGAELRDRGLHVCLVPVPAFSTLGWVADPVTGPMLRLGREGLVETLIHELLHATVYVRGDSNFDEGVATFVGQEGAVRFFAARDGPNSRAARWARDRVEDERAVDAQLGALRARVAALYAKKLAPRARAKARAALDTEARAALARLPLATEDAARLAARVRLGDACLALDGTYEADLGAYARRLHALSGNLAAFVAAAKRAAGHADPRAALIGVSTQAAHPNSG